MPDGSDQEQKKVITKKKNPKKKKTIKKSSDVDSSDAVHTPVIEEDLSDGNFEMHYGPDPTASDQEPDLQTHQAKKSAIFASMLNSLMLAAKVPVNQNRDPNQNKPPGKCFRIFSYLFSKPLYFCIGIHHYLFAYLLIYCLVSLGRHKEQTIPSPNMLYWMDAMFVTLELITIFAIEIFLYEKMKIILKNKKEKYVEFWQISNFINKISLQNIL